MHQLSLRLPHGQRCMGRCRPRLAPPNAVRFPTPPPHGSRACRPEALPARLPRSRSFDGATAAYSTGDCTCRPGHPLQYHFVCCQRARFVKAAGGELRTGKQRGITRVGGGGPAQQAGGQAGWTQCFAGRQAGRQAGKQAGKRAGGSPGGWAGRHARHAPITSCPSTSSRRLPCRPGGCGRARCRRPSCVPGPAGMH